MRTSSKILIFITMPSCSILQCKNNSRTKNLSNGGVSYHRFPKEATTKEKWIDATGRVNWMPTKLSTICSEHFLEDDFVKSGKGYKYLKATVFPTLKIVTYLLQQPNCSDSPAGFLKTRADSESYELSQSKKSSHLDKNLIAQNRHDIVSIQPHCAVCGIQSQKENDENVSAASGSTAYIEQKLKFCENKIKKQELKIKRLQSRNRRLQNRKKNVDEILRRIKEKFGISKENLDCSKNTCLVHAFLRGQENEFKNELPTMTPILTPVIAQTCTSDTEFYPEPQPGPSNKIRK